MILFSTYAARCIENRIGRALTRARQRQVDAFLPEARRGEEEEGFPEA